MLPKNESFCFHFLKIIFWGGGKRLSCPRPPQKNSNFKEKHLRKGGPVFEWLACQPRSAEV